MNAADIAFASAYQWWLFCDAHFSRMLCGRPENLTEDAVKEIARPYGVNRTLGNGLYATLSTKLSDNAAVMQCAPKERAEVILGLFPKREFRRRPLSAASKIIWFVWPEQWTMFDTYACKAVGAEGFKDFYVKLCDRGWTDLAAEVRGSLIPPFPALLAERVIDLFLVESTTLKASGFSRIAAVDHFVEALPRELSATVRKTGARIAEVLSRSELLRPS